MNTAQQRAAIMAMYVPWQREFERIVEPNGTPLTAEQRARVDVLMERLYALDKVLDALKMPSYNHRRDGGR